MIVVDNIVTHAHNAKFNTLLSNKSNVCGCHNRLLQMRG
jgi:hypothetical protein